MLDSGERIPEMVTESLRRDLPLPSLDPDLFLHELTQINTDSSSDHAGKTIPIKPTVWTDQKHKAYLNILETQFVKQLNHSLRSGGWLVQNEIRPRRAFPHISASKQKSTTKQFLVHQDRHLKAMQFGSDELPLDSTADSEDVVTRSWVHLSPSTGMHCFATTFGSDKNAIPNGVEPQRTMNSFFEPSGSSEKHPVDHNDDQSSCGTSTAFEEVCDQNYVDQQGIVNHGTTMGIPKLAISGNAIADQGFSLGKVISVNGSKDGKTSQKRGKKRLLTECPERLASPKKSEIPYFLRGS